MTNAHSSFHAKTVERTALMHSHSIRRVAESARLRHWFCSIWKQHPSLGQKPPPHRRRLPHSPIPHPTSEAQPSRSRVQTRAPSRGNLLLLVSAFLDHSGSGRQVPVPAQNARCPWLWQTTYLLLRASWQSGRLESITCPLQDSAWPPHESARYRS